MRWLPPPLLALALLLLAALPDATGRPGAASIRAQHGVVASSSRPASEVGAEILRAGGNAVDAAVGVALALAVTLPAAGNLGGGGFLLIRMADGRASAVDYREVAPAAATRGMYLDSGGNLIPRATLAGYRAAG